MSGRKFHLRLEEQRFGRELTLTLILKRDGMTTLICSPQDIIRVRTWNTVLSKVDQPDIFHVWLTLSCLVYLSGMCTSTSTSQLNVSAE